MPVALGIKGSLVASALLHVVTVACLAYVGVLLGRGASYFVGVALVGLLLTYEHAIVRPSDLSRINKAFFDINGYVSLAFLAFVLLDQYLLA
jgi:4-hydroxybenzoate polyprenyltransferase